MSWTTDLLVAFAAQLDDAGAGTWRAPPATYQPGDVPIMLGALPPAPDKAIALAAYGADQSTDDPVSPDGTLGLQVRMRGTDDPHSADDLADAVFNALHGLELPAAGVLLCTRNIVAPLGQDQSGRWERADSYRLLTHHVTTHRPG
ncbi:hypothetical protein Ssi03_25890 [Sphaerisporangium siamense]|uniref:DUF3168 domain-containing protein n=1 Tax=Sphaerisporangium siamense TaxID=795645 RepID=A0A7W7D4Z9_9ACTN|nr:minor capsid protein [Sphaerisporangium siamense]MBB4700084.1 hypothetical protein [Sphaerisporangium siamense]GII84599.1 hypothetical protein Ssi03_25890 [Sphaerisporangium siamense]